MKTLLKAAVPLACALLALLVLPPQAGAKPAYSVKEKKGCPFCHVGKPEAVVYTKAGDFYKGNHTLQGFPDAAHAPAAPKAPGAAGKTAAGAAEAGEKGKCPPQAMMEGMKGRIEEIRKSVAALREHEKKLESLTEPATFREAAIEHFRMLDDLQETHVKHMETMMERMHGETPAGGGGVMVPKSPVDVQVR